MLKKLFKKGRHIATNILSNPCSKRRADDKDTYSSQGSIEEERNHEQVPQEYDELFPLSLYFNEDECGFHEEEVFLSYLSMLTKQIEKPWKLHVDEYTLDPDIKEFIAFLSPYPLGNKERNNQVLEEIQWMVEKDL